MRDFPKNTTSFAIDRTKYADWILHGYHSVLRKSKVSEDTRKEQSRLKFAKVTLKARESYVGLQGKHGLLSIIWSNFP